MNLNIYELCKIANFNIVRIQDGLKVVNTEKFIKGLPFHLKPIFCNPNNKPLEPQWIFGESRVYIGKHSRALFHRISYSKPVEVIDYYFE